MKTILKFFSYILLFLLLIIVLFSFFYIKSVKSSLKELETDVNTKWSEYFSYSTKRVNYINVIINNQDQNLFKNNEIHHIVERNLKNRNKYKNECSLDFVKLEFDLNKKLMELLTTTNKNSREYKSLEKDSVILNDKLNSLVDEYNRNALYYNRYISIFPNFLISKRNGYKYKKYISIIYGENNDDPIIKSKELPKWAIGVDTI
jgi:hypothetical protein